MDDFNTLNGPDLSINMQANSQKIPVVQVPSLPPELLEQINEVYLLHSLAIHPSKVLPPGKSLLSIFSSRSSHPNVDSQKPKPMLKDQVSEVVTRAFWEEALESLSSPTPAVQLSRLRLLYIDLRDAVESLLPSSHPIMYTLSDPLSPTSSPLRSASGHLRALLSALHERCAPIRDADLDDLLRRLDDPPLQALPKACIDVIQGILDLADRMKGDLADFVIGTWTEQDARRWMRRKATQSERHVIMQMFTAQRIKDLYHEWLGTGSSDSNRSVATRLIAALGTPEPVSPFPPSNNILPPPLMFTAFDVLRVQNLLQALVIASSLRILIRPATDSDATWITRIWTLLELEVDKSGTEPAETKLLNLEDEVVQAARSDGEMDMDAENRLREAVRRTLRPQDPVFVLLQSRLLTAVQTRVAESPLSGTPQFPLQMRSGRGMHVDAYADRRPQEPELSVKGFEDKVLKKNVTNLVVMIKECLAWMDEVWGEFL
ncbi:hypothetical protein K439DRAFT_1381423, partial [Ramaria rubella]